MPADIEIAQAAACKPIADIFKAAGFKPDEVDLYGKYKAKVLLSARERLDKNPSGYYVWCSLPPSQLVLQQRECARARALLLRRL